MDQNIEKFIKCAAKGDATEIAEYQGASVSHPVFGTGTISKIDLRDLPDGPVFRVRFDEEVKDFNLDSFREGFITSIVSPKNISEGEVADDKPFVFQEAANAD